MHCSSLSKNALLISGVVAFHLLVLLCLLSGSFGGEQPSLPGILAVNLVGEKSKPSLLKKSSTMPEANVFASKGSINSAQVNEASSAKGTGGAGHLASGEARRTLHNPKPHYPLVSRRLREQGLVMVKLCVNEQGIVGEVGISKSSGFHSLDQSALTTLAQWRFAPVAVNSSSLSSQCFQTPVQFTLEG